MLKKRMTNRQLYYFSTHDGEVMWELHPGLNGSGGSIGTYHYPSGQDNQPVPPGVKIRLWGSELWEEPYYEVPSTKDTQCS